MNYILITFRSVTFAQRGEAVLRKSGIGCRLGRTPKWMEEQGCGYSLRLSRKDPLQCAQLLRDRQVPFRKIYLMRENGTAEELTV